MLTQDETAKRTKSPIGKPFQATGAIQRGPEARRLATDLASSQRSPTEEADPERRPAVRLMPLDLSHVGAVFGASPAEMTQGRETLRLVGDGMRRRLLASLALTPQALTPRLMRSLNANRSELSHRLNTLEQAALVRRGRRGVYYVQADGLVGVRRYLDILFVAAAYAERAFDVA